MIFSNIESARRYASLHSLFQQAFDYVRTTDLLALVPGRYPIIGEQLFVIIENAEGRAHEAARLECHRRYIDIQLVLAGGEEMGWKPLADCKQPVDPFNVGKDIQFFHDAPVSWIAVPPGHFCIFFPEDAHAPLVGSGSIRKAIFKVSAA
ncbi:MAG: YhcH/YjgK/YiaL family protein [Gallionellaceae bacterium]|nr:YhcH/YjgK/YiaL family protein [Gallionellaceae bacterium]